MNARQRTVALVAGFATCVLLGWTGCGGVTVATVSDASTGLPGLDSSSDVVPGLDGAGDGASTDGSPVTDASPNGSAAAEAGLDGFCGSAGMELDGGCGDPQTDPHNCGGCGHDCLGGACEAGACVLLPSGVLATGQYAPSAIAVDTLNVYWLNAGTPVGPGGKVPPTYVGGQVLQCAIAGCGNSPTVLASALHGGLDGPGVPSVLTVDATSVYWADGTSVRSCEKGGCGCAPKTIATANGATAVAVSTTDVYFTMYSWGQVASCPIAGCTGVPTVLAASLVGPAGITLNTSDVYWTAESTVWGCALGGCNGAPTRLWEGQPNSTQANTIGIAVDANNLYWTNAQPFNLGSVFQCAKANCAGTLVMLASARTEPRGIAVDGTNVYWVEGAGVMKCAIGGCGNAPTVFAPSGSPAIALDSTHVYFTEPGATSTDGRIAMVAK